MQKITSHIGNPSKFSKASKLALQLIEAGSVKPGTTDHFFAILEAAMSSPGACNEPSVRADYHTLFSAAQGVAEVKFALSLKQIVAQLCEVSDVLTNCNQCAVIQPAAEKSTRRMGAACGGG